MGWCIQPTQLLCHLILLLTRDGCAALLCSTLQPLAPKLLTYSREEGGRRGGGEAGGGGRVVLRCRCAPSTVQACPCRRGGSNDGRRGALARVQLFSAGAGGRQNGAHRLAAHRTMSDIGIKERG